MFFTATEHILNRDERQPPALFYLRLHSFGKHHLHRHSDGDLCGDVLRRATHK
jgi:hypothetical protein